MGIIFIYGDVYFDKFERLIFLTTDGHNVTFPEPPALNNDTTCTKKIEIKNAATQKSSHVHQQQQEV